MAGTDNDDYNRELPRSGGVTKAPAPPTRHRSTCPGDDSQQETGNPGQANRWREGRQAPLRPDSRQCCFPMQEKMQEHKRPAPTKPEPKNHRIQDPNRDPTPKTRTEDTTQRERRQKKTVAGAEPWCRGRGRSTGRSRSPRAGGREHKGKPKPKRFGFPQRLREKEKRRKEKTRRRRNQPDTRKEEGHIQKTQHGSGLEGLKNHNKYQPQRQKRETITKEQRPRPEQKNKQRNHTRL